MIDGNSSFFFLTKNLNVSADNLFVKQISTFVPQITLYKRINFLLTHTIPDLSKYYLIPISLRGEKKSELLIMQNGQQISLPLDGP